VNNTVNITVSGPVGSGKSAIAGEIEIAMKVIGVPVQYRDQAAAQSEKNMTGADWQTYIEMYQPMVTIEEKVTWPDPSHYTITVSRKWSERLWAAWAFTFGFPQWIE
jgi:cytidylate kinase